MFINRVPLDKPFLPLWLLTKPLIDFASKMMFGRFTEDFTTTGAVGYDRAGSRLLNEDGVAVVLSAITGTCGK